MRVRLFSIQVALVLATLATVSAAEDPTIQWMGEIATTAPTSDQYGSVAVHDAVYVAWSSGGFELGEPYDGQGNRVFLRKYDLNHEELWTTKLDASSPMSAGLYDAAADATGVYVCGRVSSGAYPGQVNLGFDDAFVARLDHDGNLIWVRQFGTSGYEWATSVAVDASGIYVVGTVEGELPGQTHSGEKDAFVTKFDHEGNTLWTRQFGSDERDMGHAVSCDGSGVNVVGLTWGVLPGQDDWALRVDAFVRRYDHDGNEIWTRQFVVGPQGGGHYWSDAHATVTSGTDIYVAGTYRTAFISGTPKLFLRKYDAAGNVVWTQRSDLDWSGAGSIVKYAIDLATDATGVYFGFHGKNQVGARDAYISKYAHAGDAVWTRPFGATARTLIQALASDGVRLYAAGDTSDNLTGDTALPFGKGDVFVREYDSSGAAGWTDQIGTVLPPDDSVQAVDADGSIYVVGTALGVLIGDTYEGHRAFVRKYDPYGTEVWTRVLHGDRVNQQHTSDVAVGADGVYVTGLVTGNLEGHTGSPPNVTNLFVRKYDPDGNVLWTRQMTAQPSSWDYDAASVSVCDQGVYVAGATYGSLPGHTSAGHTDAYVVKYDTAGNECWTHQFGSASNETVGGVSANATGVYVAGQTYGVLPGQTTGGASDPYLCKYDADGNLLWMRQFGTSSWEYVYDVVAAGSSAYVVGYISGSTTFPGGLGTGNAWVRRYDAAGDAVWTRQFGGTSYEHSYAVAADDSGVYVGGSTYGAFPGFTNAGGYDAFASKFDLNGGELWHLQFGTIATDRVLSLSVDATGLYAAGLWGTSGGEDRNYDTNGFVAKIITDAPPVAVLGGPYSGNEGSSIIFDASGSSEPEGAPLQFRWDFDGNGTWDTNYSSDATASYTWNDDHNGTVVVEVSDGDLTDTDSAGVTAVNVAPTITALTAPTDGAPMAVELTLTASFVDPGLDDTHTATIDWGDGTIDAVPVTAGDGGGMLSGAHTYGTGEDFVVTVSVVDDDAGVGTATTIIRVCRIDSVRTAVQVLIDASSDPDLVDKLEDVVAKLNVALEELQDKNDRQAALGNLEGAVGDIEAAVEDGLLTSEQASGLMKGLSCAGLGLAAKAIAEAKANPESDADKIAEAEGLAAEAETLVDQGVYKDAVAKLKDAVSKAEGALP